MTDTAVAAEAVFPGEDHLAHNYHPLPVSVSHGEGAWVTDVEGKRYLDLLSAYSALNFGHGHPAILAERFPNAIQVSDEDGAVFGLNSASDGRNVIISPRATGFEKQLRERGYVPHLVDLSELLLGGGGIKCCTLELRGAGS